MLLTAWKLTFQDGVYMGGLAPIALLEAGSAEGYVEGEYYKMWHPVFVLF